MYPISCDSHASHSLAEVAVGVTHPLQPPSSLPPVGDVKVDTMESMEYRDLLWRGRCGRGLFHSESHLIEEAHVIRMLPHCLPTRLVEVVLRQKGGGWGKGEWIERNIWKQLNEPVHYLSLPLRVKEGDPSSWQGLAWLHL